MFKDILTLASDDSRKEWQELTLCLNDPRGHPNLRKEIAQVRIYIGIKESENHGM